MKRSLAVAITLILIGGTAYAKPPHAENKGKKEKHHKKGKASKGKFKKGSPEAFSKAEQRTVQNYYRNLPPGLAKKYKRTGTLPPGWEAKVNAGHRLPHSLRQELQPVPNELRDSLEPGPIGSEVKRIGDKIIRLEKATNMILDVFEL